MQRVEGFRCTVVSGEIIVRDGVMTGALPGRLVRGPQQVRPAGKVARDVAVV
jgi:N-acyl-D-amino-acid deacylase